MTKEKLRRPAEGAWAREERMPLHPPYIRMDNLEIPAVASTSPNSVLNSVVN